MDLDEAQQAAARQLFLRLVTIADSDEWTRRRVPASEIVGLDVDIVALQAVIESYGTARLMTFDRDQVTGSPTVEVAHEALLTEWERLRDWIEEAREDVLVHAKLASAAAEWRGSNENPDCPLSGSRLDECAAWSDTTTLSLTFDERGFLDAAIALREARVAVEAERVARESALGRRAKRRLWGMAAAVVVLVGVGLGFLVAVLAPGPPRVALVYAGRDEGSINALLAAGLDRAAELFDIETVEITSVASLHSTYRQLGESGTDLVIAALFDFASAIEAVSGEYPDTVWAAIDADAPDMSIFFDEEEAGFLAGAAAASTSVSGRIGFVGGWQIPPVEKFRAGFEEGAHAVDPTIGVVASYLSVSDGSFILDDLARAAAARMYAEAVDVVFHAAGGAGLGVFEAARQHFESTGEHVWVVGVDSDQALKGEPALKPYVLASAVKQFDTAVIEIVRAFVDETDLPSSLNFANNGFDLVYSGTGLDDISTARIESLKTELASGQIGGSRRAGRRPSAPTRCRLCRDGRS